VYFFSQLQVAIANYIQVDYYLYSLYQDFAACVSVDVCGSSIVATLKVIVTLAKYVCYIYSILYQILLQAI